MARRRDDDEDDVPRRKKKYDDDEEDDRPRRRDDDEDEEDRPRRRKRRDDDEDDRPRRRRKRRRSSGGGGGPLDGMFAGTNIAVIILFGLCCPCVAEVLSIVALITGQDRDAKGNAMTCLIVAIIADFIRVAILLSRGGFR